MKLTWMLLLILPAVMLATIIEGGPGDRIMGFAPGDTLVDTLVVMVRVPARIGLYVNGNTEFDLADPTVTFPPVAFPGYYDPTLVGGTNPDGVDVEVFSNSQAMTWHLETSGSADFSATIALDQLFYAPDGEANPVDGTDPPGGNWVSFTTTYTEIANGLNTTGWQDESQDYVFQAETDDAPTPAAGETVTIYYRVYAQ
ncbi:MAG: hypothetical protein JSV53_11315 [candidate division WOR-3 bacterium]|nr:MAG: hypothetical protein JSV53_11315 [candidate division WOR-3 bacterium]